MTVSDSERLYFRQILSGQDFARGDAVAQQMRNFVYLIGDRETGKAAVVDPAYAVGDIIDIAAGDDMTITDVLATHYHPDHVGGDFMGHAVEGVADLLERLPDVRIHIQRVEQPWVTGVTSVSADQMVLHDSGDTVSIGAVDIELVHTPGHTPGSQCFYVQDCLVAGDTLFLDGCGRTDFPGGDAGELYRSITQRLAKVPDDTILFPGHLYSAQGHQELGVTRRNNHVFKPKTQEQWISMFG